MAAISVQNIQFQYPNSVPILSIDSLTLGSGEIVFLHGPSGCGKTTLLGLIAGVLSVDSGQLEVLGRDMGRLSNAERDHMRAKSIGYIFQVFNLVPYLNVRENIALPTLFGRRISEGFTSIKAEVESLAGALGISPLLERGVSSLV